MTAAECTYIAVRDHERLTALEQGECLPAGIGDYLWWEVSYKVQGWIVGEGVIGRNIPAWRIWNPICAAYQAVPKADTIIYA